MATGDHRLCVFMFEYEGCNSWVYAAGHARHDDPPVLVDVEDADGQSTWVLQSRSISEFFLQLAAIRIPIHTGWTVDWSDQDDEQEVVAQLGAVLPSLGFLPWREMEQRISLYGAADAIVYHDATGHGDSTLWACGRTRESLEALGRRLGVTLERQHPRTHLRAVSLGKRWGKPHTKAASQGPANLTACRRPLRARSSPT